MHKKEEKREIVEDIRKMAPCMDRYVILVFDEQKDHLD